MLAYYDFVPHYRILKEATWFAKDVVEVRSFSDAVAAAAKWIDEYLIKVVQVETVVLPNMWTVGELGSSDPVLSVIENDGDRRLETRWFQFVRVWYHAADQNVEPPYR